MSVSLPWAARVLHLSSTRNVNNVGFSLSTFLGFTHSDHFLLGSVRDVGQMANNAES